MRSYTIPLARLAASLVLALTVTGRLECQRGGANLRGELDASTPELTAERPGPRLESHRRFVVQEWLNPVGPHVKEHDDSGTHDRGTLPRSRPAPPERPTRRVPEGSRRSDGGLFATDTVLRFSLETDLRSLLNDRSEEAQGRSAVIRIAGGEEEVVELPVGVRTRGSFRLQKNICSFPPIRIDFPESGTAGTVFEGETRLKLVTHCQDRGSFEQNLLEEYLAYRIFNQLTEVSFRVRLAEISYLDTKGEVPPLTRTAFFIEEAEGLAKRLGGMILDIPGARATAFEPQYMGLLFLFQYLIGNIDWSTANSQNLEVLRIGMDHFAVPYDFDWSGLVDAPYAGPSPLTERLHESVRERLYLGVCWDRIDWSEVFRRFDEKRDSILTTIQNVPGLADYNVHAAMDYVQEFYEFLSNPEQAEADIGRMCRRG